MLINTINIIDILAIHKQYMDNTHNNQHTRN